MKNKRIGMMGSYFRSLMVLSVLMLMIVLGGYAWGGERGGIIAFVLSCLTDLGVYGFSDRFVLSRHRAQPLAEEEAPEVFRILRELSAKAGIPAPKLLMLPSASANVFSVGRDPKHATIAMTHGLVGRLNEEELSGVLGHELAHILNRDTLLSSAVATLAGILSSVASLFRWSFVWGGERDERDRDNPLPFVFFVMVMPFVALLIRLSISKTMAFRADEQGAEFCGNPLYLVSAFRKINEAAKKFPLRDAAPATAHLFIFNPLPSKRWNSLFDPHPSFEARVDRLTALEKRGPGLEETLKSMEAYEAK